MWSIFVPTSPRSSTPEADLRHRALVPDSGRGPRKVGPKRTYQGMGLSSDIGTMDINVGDRHQTSPKRERSDVEELCRDLQQTGERAVDERAPPVPLGRVPWRSLKRSWIQRCEPHLWGWRSTLQVYRTQRPISRRYTLRWCSHEGLTLCTANCLWARWQVRRWSGSSASLMDTSLLSTSLRRCSGNNTLLTGPPLDFLMMSLTLNSTRGIP